MSLLLVLGGALLCAAGGVPGLFRDGAGTRRLAVGGSVLGGLLGLAGAVAFGASDTIIAFDRFSAPIAGARWPIMTLYWLGQCGIAASAVLACGMLRAKVSSR